MFGVLESVNLKLDRAREHLDAVRYGVRTYSRGAPDILIPTESKGKVKVDIAFGPGPQTSLSLGECVYQLRSSLDHLAFSLVELNPSGIILPPEWDRKCEFPLFIRATKGKAPNPVVPMTLQERMDRVREKLPGISDAACAFIEAAQPYHRKGIANALGVLAELSNRDKHRNLNPLIPKAAVHFHYQVGTSTFAHTIGGLQHGAYAEMETLGVPEEDIVNVQTSKSIYLTLDERSIGIPGGDISVEHLLEFCLEQIKTVIVPAFDQFLNNP